MGFTEFVSENIGFAEAVVFSATPKSRALFQWGGTFFALLLLILNRTGPHRSSMQTNLLVFFLFTSFPNFLFNIVRGSFGYWISFFAVLAHLFCPENFPVSRFILFVITPDWIAKGLRGSSAGCIFCLAIGVFLVLTKLRIMTADDEFQLNCHCFWTLFPTVGGSAFLLLLGTIIFCRVFHKYRKKTDPVPIPRTSEARKKIEKESHGFLEHISDIAQSLKVYSFEELKLATNDFSRSCWIKRSVYCGTFNGDLAAIKKMDGDISKEINLLQKINHPNVIRLSGVCFKEGHWYLVYKYASNGSLSDWIFNDNNDGRSLTGTKRIQIAFDVATGLTYLHSFTNPYHVHQDIKSSDILLDSNFRAKIANFGLAQSTQAREGQLSLTKHIVGSVGYLAPEYLESGLVSRKLDVYAFGVLLLEMLTGKDVSEL